NCLPSAFVVPAIGEDGIVFPAADDVLDFGSIEPGKPVMPGRVRNILQEGMRVSREQWHVPLELHAKSGTCLLLGCRMVTVVDMNVQLWASRQLPIPAGVILDGVGGNDGQAGRM